MCSIGIAKKAITNRSVAVKQTWIGTLTATGKRYEIRGNSGSEGR